MKKQNEDAFFKHIMSKSKLELPFPDFEGTVMKQIKKHQFYNERYSRNIKMSWLCSIAGIVLGIILLVLLPRFQTLLFGIRHETIKIIFQLVFSLFVLFSLDLLIRYTRKISIHELLNSKPRIFHSRNDK